MNPTLWTNLFLLKLLRFHLVDDVLKIFSFLFSVKIEYRSLGTKLSFICYIYKNEQFLRQNSELHFYFRGKQFKLSPVPKILSHLVPAIKINLSAVFFF